MKHYREHENKALEQQLTDAKRAIEVLSFHGHLAERMNDASIDRIIALDTQMNIIAWNRRNELITGILRQNAIGEQYFDIFPELRVHQPTVNAIEEALKGRTVFLTADRLAPDKGYYENHFIPLTGEQEQVIGVMNIKHDVAHRIKAENELKALNKALVKKNKELKQRNEELVSFANVTSHDLKEPLRKIYTFVEMVAERELHTISEKSRGYLKRIQAFVQRMGILTDDVLMLAELNTTGFQASEIKIAHVLLMVRKTLQEEIELTGTEITSAELPAISGYRPLISRLLYQLLTNAIKFRRQGVAPRIDIRSETVSGAETDHPEASADMQYIRLIVEDNGMGFEPDDKERIFQLFERLQRKDYPGTGVGLALCKKIAAIHGGFITAEGKETSGGIFSVYFPVAKR